MLDLRQFPMFAGLTEAQAAALQERASQREHPAGTLLFQAGEPAVGFYLLASGAVKVFKLSPEGREQILNVFQAGQSFAEAAVFQGKRYPACAQCVHDSVLVYISREVLLAQIRETPELAFQLMSGMAHKLRTLVALVEDLTLRDARGRLCRYLSGLVPDGESGPVEIVLPFSQVLLAKMLGIAGETMSRSLKALQEEGLVENLHQGRLLVKSPEGLEAAV